MATSSRSTRSSGAQRSAICGAIPTSRSRSSIRRIPRSARWFGGALLALSVWTGLSAFWSIDSSASWRELERDALYVAAFVGALGLLRFGGRAAVAAGVALGATALAGYSLVELMAGRGRTVFDWSVPSAPIGY